MKKEKDVTNVDGQTDTRADRHTDTHSEYSVNLDSDSQKYMYLCFCDNFVQQKERSWNWYTGNRDTGEGKLRPPIQMIFFFQTELSLSTIVGIILPPLTTSPTAKFNPWTGVRM